MSNFEFENGRRAVKVLVIGSGKFEIPNPKFEMLFDRRSAVIRQRSLQA